MNIIDLIAAPRLSVERIRSEALGSLRPGQQIGARVLSATRDHQVLLAIGGQRVRAQTRVGLRAGERLLLSVTNTGNPLQLQVLNQSPVVPARARALRAALPKQAPLQQLFGRLRDFTADTGTRPPAPAAVDPFPGNPPSVHAAAGQPPGKGNPPPSAGARGAPVAPSPSPAQPDPASRPPVAPAAVSTPPPLNAAEPLPSPLSRAAPPTGRPPDRDLSQRITQVLAQALDADEAVTPARLRRAFGDSGLLLEARLAAGQRAGPDLKGSLLQLRTLLRERLEAPLTVDRHPGPPATTHSGLSLIQELLSQTESGLARVLINQLASLPPDDGGKQVWQFELPVRLAERIDCFRFQVSRDGGGGERETAQAGWNVRIDFDLAGLGPVCSHLSLRGGRISSHFVARREATGRLLEQALPQLQRAFTRAGLEVGRLSARHDEHLEALPLPGPSHPLLDEKA